jgi:hypothetical protein
MKIRLEGTRNEINWAITLIKNTPEMKVIDESKFYPNRDGKTYRQYLEVRQSTLEEMPKHWQGSESPQPKTVGAVLGGQSE